ncbi:hypothetical protein V7168_09065 [Neobacillus drentensis]
MAQLWLTPANKKPSEPSRWFQWSPLFSFVIKVMVNCLKSITKGSRMLLFPAIKTSRWEQIRNRP